MVCPNSIGLPGAAKSGLFRRMYRCILIERDVGRSPARSRALPWYFRSAQSNGVHRFRRAVSLS